MDSRQNQVRPRWYSSRQMSRPNQRHRESPGSVLVESFGQDQLLPLDKRISLRTCGYRFPRTRPTCVYWLALGCPLFEKIEQLSCHQRGWICLLKSTPFADDIIRGIRSLDALVPRRSPPVFHLFYLLIVDGILRLADLFTVGQ